MRSRFLPLRVQSILHGFMWNVTPSSGTTSTSKILARLGSFFSSADNPTSILAYPGCPVLIVVRASFRSSSMSGRIASFDLSMAISMRSSISVLSFGPNSPISTWFTRYSPPSSLSPMVLMSTGSSNGVKISLSNRRFPAAPAPMSRFLESCFLPFWVFITGFSCGLNISLILSRVSLTVLSLVQRSALCPSSPHARQIPSTSACSLIWSIKSVILLRLSSLSVSSWLSIVVSCPSWSGLTFMSSSPSSSSSPSFVNVKLAFSLTASTSSSSSISTVGSSSSGT